jgi:nitrite reductase (NADH) small subunit
MFTDIGPREEFAEGSTTIVALADREIGVIRWRGELFAVRNLCPHQLGPVCRGHVMPLIVAGEGVRMDVDADEWVVVCPWHGWEFSGRTGQAIAAGTSGRLRTYPVKEADGRVFINVNG